MDFTKIIFFLHLFRNPGISTSVICKAVISVICDEVILAKQTTTIPLEGTMLKVALAPPILPLVIFQIKLSPKSAAPQPNDPNFSGNFLFSNGVRIKLIVFSLKICFWFFNFRPEKKIPYFNHIIKNNWNIKIINII